MIEEVGFTNQLLAENQLLMEQLKDTEMKLNFLKNSLPIYESDNDTTKTIRQRYKKLLDKITFLEEENYRDVVTGDKGHSIHFCNGVEYVLLAMRKIVEEMIEEERLLEQSGRVKIVIRKLEEEETKE